MLQLVSKTPPATAQAVLKELQDKINALPTFSARVEKAQSLWKSKSSTKKREAAFKTMSETLKEQCVHVNICNYCEHNESADIEHVFPKSFFPEYAFVWANYLRACKNCNSTYKLDKCYVLDDAGTLHSTVRGEEPVHKSIAFINPKVEDPTRFMILNLETFHFEKMEDLNSAEQVKCEKTLEILQLNQRDTLIAARKNACQYYYERLDRLCRLLQAANYEEFCKLLAPHEDEIAGISMALDELKSHFLESYKKDIQRFMHPSVWYAIKKVGSKTSVKWQRVFQTIPEALDW